MSLDSNMSLKNKVKVFIKINNTSRKNLLCKRSKRIGCRLLVRVSRVTSVKTDLLF